MIHRSSPRRSFLGSLLSATAALGAFGTGALSALVTACDPKTKYGGPPPDMATKYGGPVPVDLDPPGTEDGGLEPEPEQRDAGEAEQADASSFAQPPDDGTSTVDAPPAPVPKYGGPPPPSPTSTQGIARPKYGGPRPARKYGGPPPTTY